MLSSATVASSSSRRQTSTPLPHLRANTNAEEARRRRQLIVGGQVAQPGKYPYFVSIDNGNCGGSLIAPDIVLTAGHCKPHRTIRKHPHSDDVDRVRVGIFERQHSHSSHSHHHSHHHHESAPSPATTILAEESFAVLDAIRHERFEVLGDDEFRYDFTIIRLNGTATHPHLELHRQELLSSLDDDDDNDDDDDDDDDLDSSAIAPFKSNIQVTVMGMGDTNKEMPSKSNVLREVNLTVVPNEECERARGRGISYKGRIHPSHLCTFAHHKDSCSYDSGSPIILYNHNINHENVEARGFFQRFHRKPPLPPPPVLPPHAHHALVGMVSWGEECADDIFPAVNSRISVVLDWIDDIVCDWSDHPPASFGCDPPGITPAINAGGGWFSHLPQPGDGDFVIVVLLCIMIAGASRLWWRLRRRDCDYEQLK